MHVGVVLQSTDKPECSLDHFQDSILTNIEDTTDLWNNRKFLSTLRSVQSNNRHVFGCDLLNAASEVLRERLRSG